MKDIELASALRSAVSGLHKGLRRQMTPVSLFSMTEMETIGLLLRHDALLPTELAALTRVKTQSMSQILKKLEEYHVIKRTPSKNDKRKVYVSITAQGKKMVEKTRYERDEWLKKLMDARLTEKEKELLVKALPVLNKLMKVD